MSETSGAPWFIGEDGMADSMAMERDYRNDLQGDLYDAADAQQANEELHQRYLDAIYSAAMYGLPEEQVRLLCFGCGVSYKDLKG